MRKTSGTHLELLFKPAYMRAMTEAFVSLTPKASKIGQEIAKLVQGYIGSPVSARDEAANGKWPWWPFHRMTLITSLAATEIGFFRHPETGEWFLNARVVVRGGSGSIRTVQSGDVLNFSRSVANAIVDPAAPAGPGQFLRAASRLEREWGKTATSKIPASELEGLRPFVNDFQATVEAVNSWAEGWGTDLLADIPAKDFSFEPEGKSEYEVVVGSRTVDRMSPPEGYDVSVPVPAYFKVNVRARRKISDDADNLIYDLTHGGPGLSDEAGFREAFADFIRRNRRLPRLFAKSVLEIGREWPEVGGMRPALAKAIEDNSELLDVEINRDFKFKDFFQDVKVSVSGNDIISDVVGKATTDCISGADWEPDYSP